MHRLTLEIKATALKLVRTKEPDAACSLGNFMQDDWRHFTSLLLAEEEHAPSIVGFFTAVVTNSISYRSGVDRVGERERLRTRLNNWLTRLDLTDRSIAFDRVLPPIVVDQSLDVGE